MRSLLALMFFVLVTPAFALDSDFYHQKVPVDSEASWDVWGQVHTAKENLMCKATFTYKDGSYILFGKDFDRDDLFIYVHNISWEMTNAKFPVNIKVQVNTTNRYGQRVKNGELNAIVLDKNSIVITRLKGRDVWDVLTKANSMVIVMPDNIPNAKIIGALVPNVARRMAECFKMAEKRMESDGESAFTTGKKKDDGGI